MSGLNCLKHIIPMKIVLFVCLIFSSSLSAQQIRFNYLQQQTQVTTNRIKSFEQDEHGFIWIASSDQLWRFDGYELKSFNEEIKALTGVNPVDISDLVVDDKNQLWISTRSNGLFLYDGMQSEHFNPADISSTIKNNGVYSILADGDDLWVGSSKGLIKHNKNADFSYFPLIAPGLTTKSKTTNILKLSEAKLLVSTQHHIFIFDINSEKYQHLPQNPSQSFYFNFFWRDNNNQVLVGTNKGLFHLDGYELKPLYANTIKGNISGILKLNNHYWVSSLAEGLWRIDEKTQTVKQYKTDVTSEFSLKENTISTLFKDNDGLIWLGGFMGSVVYFDPENLNFGLHDKNSLERNCMSSGSTNKIITRSDDTVLIISDNELAHVNYKTNKCRTIDLSVHSDNIDVSVTPIDITHTHDGQWLLSNLGLHKLNNDFTLSNFHPVDYIYAYFLNETTPGHLVIGTNSGLIYYNQTNNQAHKPKAINEAIATATYYSSVTQNNGEHNKRTIYNTNKGLVHVNSSGTLDYYSALSSKFPELDTISLHINNTNKMWVGSYKNGWFELNEEGQILQHINTINGHSNFSVYSITTDDLGHLWLGTDIGLVNYNPIKQSSVIYNKSDGLQGGFFNINSVSKSSDGVLFFGGRNGFNVFDPKSIQYKKYTNTPVLTGIKLFNKEVDFYDHNNPLELVNPINETEQLFLDHQDYIISLGFSALHFSDAKRIQYAYMLDGFDPDWNIASSTQRTATYTNLPSGNYTFKLKAALKDKIWGSQVKTLNIQVSPPPWLSWWAITSYVLLLMAVVFGYIQWKTKNNIKVAILLRKEVAKKTEELHIQKQTVESLLVKKNDLFSNVSHEFRTPLTLILGPIKNLLSQQTDVDNINQLNMVNRNANRLLLLVEQLLQIARVSDFNNIQTRTQKTKKQVQSLVDSFQHMARNKKIDLTLSENNQATINVTEQFIDTVLGNLVSNAIKYTQSGGTVTVRSEVSDESLFLSVEDSGVGLTTAQQNDIFNRFKRLESHQEVEGLGIGLSVVEEVVKLNNGGIKVDSEIGVGSLFKVNIPLSDDIHATEESSISTLVQQLQIEPTDIHPYKTQDVTELNDNELNTVLVIEDNNDMREHIATIIKPHYNCLTAVNGLKGVAIAIEQIPDLIISDVMMPEMDGFKVARIIRSDQRTSHIPLMLLTALNDKASRIKGWRENVDTYMSKPFDRDELLVQLENMLTIRDILKRQVTQNFNTVKTKTSLLPQKDQDFIDKLNTIIEDNYQNPILNRMKMANLMAVSDRQLQRKLKALTDRNPMDMLREYRLNKAKILLKDGYQVSQVADDCGYNSLSYFSQCFKAQFGLSPKNYQQMN